MKAYIVTRWSEYFETNESRKRRELDWVAVPNKHDGGSYRRLTKHERFAEIFCGWVLILEVASKMPTRGLLFKDGRSLDCEDLSDMTGARSEVFEAAIEACMDPKVGWIEQIEVSDQELSDSRPGHLPRFQHPMPLHAGVAADAAGVAASSAGVCRSSGPTETETETEQDQTENEGDSTQGYLEIPATDSPSASVAAPIRSSGSVSALGRMKAYAEFHGLLKPVMGKSGPQGSADFTCVDGWFNQTVWPKHIDPEVGAAQYEKVKVLVARAKRADVQNPMAWLTTRINRCKV